MMLSIAYLLLTLSGIFYSNIFYSKFDIPILKLADISDWLIAGISDPTAIVMFCGGIVLLFFPIGFSDLAIVNTINGKKNRRVLNVLL